MTYKTVPCPTRHPLHRSGHGQRGRCSNATKSTKPAGWQDTPALAEPELVHEVPQGASRGRLANRQDETRGAFFEGLLLLVDFTGRLFREGKATISREVAEILTRIAGKHGWSSSSVAAAGCWAGSSRSRGDGCVLLRSSAACTTWRTWAAARLVKPRRSHEPTSQAGAASDLSGTPPTMPHRSAVSADKPVSALPD